MKHQSRVITIILICGFLATALACHEQQPLRLDVDSEPIETANQADLVFVGVVVGVRQQSQWLTWAKSRIKASLDHASVSFASKRRLMVEFEIIEPLKGVTETRHIVFLPPQGATCGVSPRPGERYLVYAFENDGALFANSCLRTVPIGQETAEVMALRRFLGARRT